MRLKTTTKDQEKRIAELVAIMQKEVENDFANGDLWNEGSDKIDRIHRIGQENKPSDIIDENGYIIGYRLENGQETYFEGMTFENSY